MILETIKNRLWLYVWHPIVSVVSYFAKWAWLLFLTYIGTKVGMALLAYTGILYWG